MNPIKFIIVVSMVLLASELIYHHQVNGQIEDNQTSANSSKLNEFIDCYNKIISTVNSTDDNFKIRTYNLCEVLIEEK